MANTNNHELPKDSDSQEELKNSQSAANQAQGAAENKQPEEPEKTSCSITAPDE